MLDYWLHEFKSKYCQAVIAGPLNKALNPQLLSYLNKKNVFSSVYEYLPNVNVIRLKGSWTHCPF